MKSLGRAVVAGFGLVVMAWASAQPAVAQYYGGQGQGYGQGYGYGYERRPRDGYDRRGYERRDFRGDEAVAPGTMTVGPVMAAAMVAMTVEAVAMVARRIRWRA